MIGVVIVTHGRLAHEFRAALEHATPYFRTLLAPRLKLRVVPSLRFEFDHTLEAGARIEELLREIKNPPEEGAGE